MSKTIIKAPCVNLTNLESLFIEMTARNCNLKCKHCYIDFPERKVKDYIPIDKIKQSLIEIDKKELHYIHLTGGEPMLHPEFNQILRLCLKYSNVVIHTNAYSINDKKARFMRKVEEENSLNNEIIFMLSIDHYIESENDKIRGRGSYRKTIHAIQSLIKYEFNPILSIVNHFSENENFLKQHFKELCSSINFETSEINFNIIPLMNKDYQYDISDNINYDSLNIDCKKSRTLTINGVFSCPLLSCDNRGKSGTDFKDYSSKSYLETAFCAQCVKYNKKLFSFEL